MCKYLLALMLCLLGLPAHAAGLADYSTSAGGNIFLFPEPMPAGDVNDAARQFMADTRTWYQAPQWIDLGFAPTRVNNTTFTVSGDKTVFFPAGRRLQLADGLTLYGSVSSSVYSSPNTTVIVTLDSGNLSASLSAAAVGLVDGTRQVIPQSAVAGFTDRLVSGTTTLQSYPGGLSATTAGVQNLWLNSAGLLVSGTIQASGTATVGGLSTTGTVTASLVTASGVSATGAVTASTVTANAVNAGSVSASTVSASVITSPYAVRAWANFGGTTGCTVSASANVSGCTKVTATTGVYGVSFTAPLTVPYAIVCTNLQDNWVSVYRTTFPVPNANGFIVQARGTAGNNDIASGGMSCMVMSQ